MGNVMGRSRRALTAGALVVLSAAAAIAGCGAADETAHHHHHGGAAAAATPARATGAAWRPKAGLPLRDPRQLYARDGVLRVDLTAARGRIVVSGSSVVAQPFNGQFVGPTLHIRPGETIEATIHNKTNAQTNIHYHGLHVSPTGLSDNVFRTFEPGSTSRSVVECRATTTPAPSGTTSTSTASPRASWRAACRVC